MAKIACLFCDLLLEQTTLNAHQKALCPRCQETLYQHGASLSSCLALLISLLLLYFPTILLPFLSMSRLGLSTTISLLDSVISVAHGGMLLLALTVALLVLLIPLLKYIGLVMIISALLKKRRPLGGGRLFRWVLSLSRWSMIEVYLIGVIVALIKLASLAHIDFAVGFYCFILLMLLDTLVTMLLPEHAMWQRIKDYEQ